MALDDVFRDNGGAFAYYTLIDEAVLQEINKYQNVSSQELWDLLISFSPHSPKGKAVQHILMQREPEKFKKSFLKNKY